MFFIRRVLRLRWQQTNRDGLGGSLHDIVLTKGLISVLDNLQLKGVSYGNDIDHCLAVSICLKLHVALVLVSGYTVKHYCSILNRLVIALRLHQYSNFGYRRRRLVFAATALPALGGQ